MTNYWSYPGSLTTPPCWEGIKWTVLADVQNISDAQLEGYDKWFKSNSAYAGYNGGNGNNRAIQELHDRKVYKAQKTNAATLWACALALSAMLTF